MSFQSRPLLKNVQKESHKWIPGDGVSHSSSVVRPDVLNQAYPDRVWVTTGQEGVDQAVPRVVDLTESVITVNKPHDNVEKHVLLSRN